MTVILWILAIVAGLITLFIWLGGKALRFAADNAEKVATASDDPETQKEIADLKKTMEQKLGRELNDEEFESKFKDLMAEMEGQLNTRLRLFGLATIVLLALAILL